MEPQQQATGGWCRANGIRWAASSFGYRAGMHALSRNNGIRLIHRCGAGRGSIGGIIHALDSATKEAGRRNGTCLSRFGRAVLEAASRRRGQWSSLQPKFHSKCHQQALPHCWRRPAPEAQREHMRRCGLRTLVNCREITPVHWSQRSHGRTGRSHNSK